MKWLEIPGKETEKDFTAAIDLFFGCNHENLIAFAPIISELYSHYKSVEQIRQLQILELGPGRKTMFAEVLSPLCTENFRCVGLPRWNTSLDCYRFFDINDYLSSRKNNSLDIIYSRFVLEENSFHPITLLQSSAFWKMVRKGKSEETMRHLPGSKEYIHQTYRLIAKKIRPGGKVIAMLVDRKRGELPKDPEIQSKFTLCSSYSIGKRMGLITLQKNIGKN